MRVCVRACVCASARRYVGARTHMLLVGWLVGWSICQLVNWLVDWSISWLAGWLVNWLIDWSVDRLVGLLTGWLVFVAIGLPRPQILRCGGRMDIPNDLKVTVQHGAGDHVFNQVSRRCGGE